jgi:hypothetical protein
MLLNLISLDIAAIRASAWTPNAAGQGKVQCRGAVLFIRTPFMAFIERTQR